RSGAPETRTSPHTTPWCGSRRRPDFGPGESTDRSGDRRRGRRRLRGRSCRVPLPCRARLAPSLRTSAFKLPIFQQYVLHLEFKFGDDPRGRRIANAIRLTAEKLRDHGLAQTRLREVFLFIAELP